MIRFLYFSLTLLTSALCQQSQLIYDQHFVDPPQHPHNAPPNYNQFNYNQNQNQNQQIQYHTNPPSQFHSNTQFQNSQYAPLEQNQYYNNQNQYAQNPQTQFSQNSPQYSQSFQQQQFQQPMAPHHQMSNQQPNAQPMSVQPMGFDQKNNHPMGFGHRIGNQPMGYEQNSQNMNMQFQPQQPVHMGQNVPQGAIGIPVPASEFASRRGPLDKMIKGAKHYFPTGKKRSRPGSPVRFMEMNRLPKPPKYPLYDMPDIGMATPPPPPLMSGIATNMYATFAHPPSPGQRVQNGPNKKPRGPAPHRGKPGGRRPPPQATQRFHQGRPNPKMKKRPQGNQMQRGRRPAPHNMQQTNFEHTMSSNLDPQQASPPLGRPLNYDEYMQRPSHSFTDDPWNFDPYAANYNSGMNTFAMKYNYDPLGMNSLDKTQTHLDPDALSYMGDYHTLSDSSIGASSSKGSQVGGWEKTDFTQKEKTKDKNEEPVNSFNLYEQDGRDSSKHKAIKAPGIELTIETSDANEEEKRNNYNDDDSYTNDKRRKNYDDERREDRYGGSRYDSGYNNKRKEQNAWNTYSQSAHDVYEPEGSENVEQRHKLSRLREQSEYENGKYDEKTKLHTFGLSEDYVRRDRPVSDLSDSYNPHGSSNLSTSLTPPSETAEMFKRQSEGGGQKYNNESYKRRETRNEITPLVELEGLSLFKDILNNEQANGARTQLYKVLSS